MLSFLFQQKKIAIVFTIFVVLLGLSSLQYIQRDKFPNVDLDKIVIKTFYPGASPQDVELNVTNKIEKELKSITGMKSYTSVSKENFSFINIEIEPDIKDKEAVKRDIRNAVNRVQGLPSEIKDLPIVQEIKISLKNIIQINLIDTHISYEQLRLVSDNLEKTLERIEEVAKVDQKSYLDTEVKVYISPEKLKKYNLSLTQVVKHINDYNIRYTAGDNNSSLQEKNIVVLSKYAKASDIENIVVKSLFDGPAVRVKDIATIKNGLVKETSILHVNGHKSFSLLVKKQEQADIITTVDKIKKTVQSFKQANAKTLEVFYSNDDSKRVKNRLNIVMNNGITGLILVLIVLGTFLSFRTAFWVSLSLPVALLGTIAFMVMFGETINLVSLAGMILVLGLVVDDSIIIAESIHSHIEEEGRNVNAVVNGFKKVIVPVITSLLTTILSFSAMFMMGGVMGKFVYIFPLVVIFALTMSLLEVTIALPTHLLHIKKNEKKITWFKKYELKFENFLKIFLHYRYIVAGFFVALLVGSIIFAVTQLRFTLFPAKSSDLITVRVETAVGTSLKEFEKIVKKVEPIIMNIVGKNLESLSTNIAGKFPHITNMDISLIPNSERELSAKEIMKKLKQSIKNIKGIKRVFFSIKRSGPPRGSDIEINLTGPYEDLKKVANQLIKTMTNITGIYDIDRDDKSGKPRIEVKLDNKKIEQLNINYADISTYLKASFNGVEVTSMRKGDNDVYFRVYLGGDTNTEDDILKIEIANKNNKMIALSQFAKLKYIEGEPDYNHYKGHQSILISASINDTQTTSTKAIKDIFEKVNIKQQFPEVHMIVEGGSKDDKKSMQDFKKAFILAIFAMFLLLSVLFNSYSQPILVLFAIPFGVIGIIWSFFLHGEPLSFFAILGLLALVGVVVNGAIVLMDHLNHKNINLMQNKEDIIMAIASGTKNRFRPIVLTTLTTLAGILPMVYGIGGTDALLRPMAMALGYGLLFSSVLTLILLPCLYLINIDIKLFIQQKIIILKNKFFYKN
ncbi:Acriflavin resistance protein [hydrothermal vent metagenome]|uniref:Acriflavin resistance protein n=1 Tax=hydrothermal vent metagenome TaxID=652676 RepID=A0A1W1CT65_9ZZZZ